MNIEYVLPEDIEHRSFEIIESELGGREFPEEIKPILYRVIHTTADFDYADNLCFSENAVETALGLLRNGAVIVTDTNMAKAGMRGTVLHVRPGNRCRCQSKRDHPRDCFGGPRRKAREAGDFRLRERADRAYPAS